MRMHRTAFLVMLGCICMAGQQRAGEHRLADSLQHKLDRITANAKAELPSPAATVMTEEEINDYFAAGKIKLPQGVNKVTFQGHSGIVTALTSVDFDQIRAGQRSSNPLLAIFSGTHNVNVEADVAGSEGKGKVHIRSVMFDGQEIPRMLLQLFAEHYLTPKYPNVGLDSEFDMPDRIDTATVGYHKLTVIQR